MSEKPQAGGGDSDEKTIKTAGQIVKYSREIYHLESVEEVATLTLEATPHFIEGYPSTAVIEIRSEGLTVLESMIPGVSASTVRGTLVDQAYETGAVHICADEDVEITYQSDDLRIVDPDDCQEHESGVTLAAPSVYSDDVGNSGAILLVQWSGLDRIEKHHVRPVDFLAEHVATAIVNIRSRERLERARNDLAKRKEMIEVYDRLLRHDLGNDLQVITGFSDAVVSKLEAGSPDERILEYARKIEQTSKSAAELINSVGETVKTIQSEGQPAPRKLEPILTDVVEDVDTKFESLSIEYDPSAFDYDVFSGDLIDSVFTNIISNAAVHNHEAVSLEISAEEPSPETVVVSVADDGTGIASEVRDEIFEMGKKGPESDGTGFGLGLARTLLESYGGGIGVRESDRGGAEFRITLERA